MTKAETNYTVSEIEMLAIVKGMKHHHNFIANKKFYVITDHVSLKYIQNMKEHRGRLAR